MTKKTDSFLDGLMKGIGHQLGKRRKDVHDAIDRFHEEVEKADAEGQEDSPTVESINDETVNDRLQDEKQDETNGTK